MSLRALLDTAYVVLVDDVVSPMLSRGETRRVVDDWLAGKEPARSDATPSPNLSPPAPVNPDPETWGLEPDHIAAQDRMMRIGGAPA